jgi:hypothetical protein
MFTTVLTRASSDVPTRSIRRYLRQRILTLSMRGRLLTELMLLILY